MNTFRKLLDAILRGLAAGLSPGGLRAMPRDLCPGLPSLWPGDAPARRAALEGHARAGAPGLVAATLAACLPGMLLLAELASLPGDFWTQPWPRAALQGLGAALPGVLAGLALDGLRRLPGRLVSAGLAVCTGGLFFLGLKPFAMLLGGAVIGVLLLPEPAQAVAPPPSPDPACLRPWRFLALFGVLAAATGGVFLLDPGLGRIFLAAFKAEFWGLGGAGAWPLLSGDYVRARHWLAPGAFADLAALALAVPGPAAALAAGCGMLARGLPGALAAGAGAALSAALTLLASAPCMDAVAASPWARKALAGTGAVLCGITAGLAALTAAGRAWDASGIALASAALAASLWGAGRVWVALAAALAGVALYG
ncbi:hypothetical protein NNJEOMEG_03259 [Fundidesulfovibrio magnetotacticus]|uniref:Chromate transporter n=1 Tax=Fundidesulfovibrio magnetotacticus TaxID=2730080 RepID=A0A6V8M038_9BACT|nr:chromate transporter [Fundidesulfovibrio magnetotacticus]GFK95396.1 hypothetical protein NNJEOMEG_03259 [Fundidesulfovibrio magnetotacticus]